MSPDEEFRGTALKGAIAWAPLGIALWAVFLWALLG